jgi:hypothetical protein
MVPVDEAAKGIFGLVIGRLEMHEGKKTFIFIC